MNKHITVLEDSRLITECEDSWGSLLLLAAKPHQEMCFNINDFIWRLCVSYSPLNSITRSFEYPISRFADSIEDLSDSCDPLSMIYLCS